MCDYNICFTEVHCGRPVHSTRDWAFVAAAPTSLPLPIPHGHTLAR